MLREISAYLSGFVIAVFAGHVFVRRLSDTAWRAIRPEWVDLNFRPHAWQPRIVGLIERALYLVALLLGKGEFIGVWLALKVAGQWKRWSEESAATKGRAVYQNFLLASGASIAFAIAGYQVTLWVMKDRLFYAGAIPLLLIMCMELLGRTVARWAQKERILWLCHGLVMRLESGTVSEIEWKEARASIPLTNRQITRAIMSGDLPLNSEIRERFLRKL